MPDISAQKPRPGAWVRTARIKWRDEHIEHRRGWQGAPIGISELEARAVSKDQVLGTLEERIVYKALVIRKIQFDFQSSIQGGRLMLGGMVADFILLDSSVIIRVQSEKWHSGFVAEAKDASQQAILESLGYYVLDIWDWQVHDPGLMEDWLRDNIDTGWPSRGGSIVVTGDLSQTNVLPDKVGERLDMIEAALFRGVVSPLVRISASNIDVISLSAISANIGTVTAGTLIGTLFETSATVGEGVDGEGILINADHIAAYNTTGDLQFEIDSATGVARTGVAAPYAKLSDAGLSVYSTNTSEAGLYLNSSDTGTVSTIREADGGIAFVSDQADICLFRMYDTEYDAGVTNLRLEVSFTSAAGYWKMLDHLDTEMFSVTVTDATDLVEIASLGTGDLRLISGSGQVSVSDDLEPDTDNTLYLGDFERGFKGLIVHDQTDGNDYLVHTDNGAIHVTIVAA